MSEKSFGLYRRCAGDRDLREASKPIAGASSIQPLARSRLWGLWGLVFGVLRGVPLVGRLPGDLARRRGTVGVRVGLREQVICRSFRP